MRKQRGFTLAELLVVIAIIGLLSSIVLVATRKTTERAKITAVLQFAAQVHHAIGAYSVGIWDFDEGTDNSTATGAQDRSGLNNNGTCTNCSTWQCASDNKEDTPTGQGCSLQFDGSNDYIEIPNSNSLENITESSFTWVAWYYPDSVPPSTPMHDRHAILCKQGYHTYLVYLTDQRFSFNIYNSSNTSFPQYSLPSVPNKWYYVAGTVNDNSKIMMFYINGKLVGSQNYSGILRDYGTNPVRIGICSNPGANYDYPANGKIDEVRIYSEALTSAQIQKLYAEGLERHLTMTND